jgi:hypothetical protein
VQTGSDGAITVPLGDSVRAHKTPQHAATFSFPPAECHNPQAQQSSGQFLYSLHLTAIYDILTLTE